jgi:hypothetical protein
LIHFSIKPKKSNLETTIYKGKREVIETTTEIKIRSRYVSPSAGYSGYSIRSIRTRKQSIDLKLNILSLY